MLVAINKGDAVMTKELISLGANLNFKDEVCAYFFLHLCYYSICHYYYYYYYYYYYVASTCGHP